MKSESDDEEEAVQMLSLTCCNVQNGSTSCPLHLISICNPLYEIQLGYTQVRLDQPTRNLNLNRVYNPILDFDG